MKYIEQTIYFHRPREENWEIIDQLKSIGMTDSKAAGKMAELNYENRLKSKTYYKEGY
jgi:hypothetical protein